MKTALYILIMCGIPLFILVIATVRTSHTQSRGSVVVYQVCDGMTASMLKLVLRTLLVMLTQDLVANVMKVWSIWK